MNRVMIKTVTFFLVGLALASPAHGSDRETREIAHCGYLTFLAADQLYEAGESADRQDAMIADLVDFSSIYAALTARGNLENSADLSPALLADMTSLGHSVHSERIRSMSTPNALRLTNRLLNDCRADLRLFEIKMRAS